MNTERNDERDAKRVVERLLGISLEHADTHGGVDYRSADGSVAMEVTRVTDGRKRAARHGLARSSRGDDETPLASCWHALVPATHESTKNLAGRIRQLLPELEKAGIRNFYWEDIRLHIQEQPHHRQLLKRVLETGVESLWAVQQDAEPDHEHELLLSTTWDGSVEGSDSSLESLLHELNRRKDNAKKLADSNADARHLFVWLDGDTAYEIQRALDGPPPKGLEAQFGPPKRAPQLHSAVTHLWVVHQGTRLGWFWDGSTWRALAAV